MRPWTERAQEVVDRWHDLPLLEQDRQGAGYADEMAALLTEAIRFVPDLAAAYAMEQAR